MRHNPRPQKVSMIVAQRIMQDVSRNGVKPGEPLPPERVMLEKYQIGRGTLREALRLLEYQGAIVLKPGPKGGPVLLSPDAGPLASNLLLLMQLKGTAFKAVVEARGTLEPVTSRLATQRMTTADLERLEGTIIDMRENLGDEHAFLETNKHFHDIIAWCSGNPLLGYFTESMLGIMDGTVMGIDYPPRRRTAILKAHEEIYQSMAARDPDEAEARMSAHIDAYVVYAQKKFPDLLERTVEWSYALS